MASKDAMRALQSAKIALKKKYGDEVFRDSSAKVNMKAISTGSPSLDRAIGIGGLPEGRIVEIFGAESCGKTSLVSILCGEAQKKYPDKYVGFVDVEHAFNPPYAASLGMQQGDDKTIFTQPSSGEEALETLLTLVETGQFSVMVLDSVGGVQTKRQLEGDIGKETMGEVARVMSQTMPKIVKAANKHGTLVIFINQQRATMDMYGPKDTTMGGKALPYFSSVRLKLRKKDPILDGTTPIGQSLEIKVIKNKVGNPFGVIESALYFHRGFDKQAELVDEAIKAGIIERAGPWFYIDKDTDDQLRFQGKVSVVEFYRTEPEKYQVMLDRLLSMESEVIEVPDDISEEEVLKEKEELEKKSKNK